MKNLILIGMPGSGKSKVGSLLARKLKKKFLDLDEFNFIQGLGRDPAEFLAELGPEKFLDLEAQQTQKLQIQNAVIATSGSTPLRPAGMQHLRQNAFTVWLKIPLAILQKRINQRSDSATRIVGAAQKSLAAIAAKREPYYLKHHDAVVSIQAEEPAEHVAEQVLAISQNKIL